MPQARRTRLLHTCIRTRLSANDDRDSPSALWLSNIRCLMPPSPQHRLCTRQWVHTRCTWQMRNWDSPAALWPNKHPSADAASTPHLGHRSGSLPVPFYQPTESLSAPEPVHPPTVFNSSSSALPQAACIPLALTGRDVCGSAVTGSGKTAAFALPLLERLLHRSRRVAATYVLVLTPVRELAVQVGSVAEGRLTAYGKSRAVQGGAGLSSACEACRMLGCARWLPASSAPPPVAAPSAPGCTSHAPLPSLLPRFPPPFLPFHRCIR